MKHSQQEGEKCCENCRCVCPCHTPQGQAFQENLERMNHGLVYTPTTSEDWEKELDVFMEEEYGHWKIGRAEVKKFIKSRVLSSHHKALEEKMTRIIHEEMGGMQLETNAFIACDDFAIRIIKRLSLLKDK